MPDKLSLSHNQSHNGIRLIAIIAKGNKVRPSNKQAALTMCDKAINVNSQYTVVDRPQSCNIS